MDNIGKATYRNGKLYFDEIGWSMIKAVARRKKKSPQKIVIAALMRYARKYGKKTKDA